MTQRLQRHVWDWRISAHCRVVSLGSLWLLVFGLPVLGGAAAPLIAARFAASGAQLLLNHRLGRVHPIPRPNRGDWLLLALALIGASVAAAVEPGAGVPHNPALVALALIPFSAAQLRIAARSYRAASGGGVPAPSRQRPAPAAASL